MDVQTIRYLPKADNMLDSPNRLGASKACIPMPTTNVVAMGTNGRMGKDFRAIRFRDQPILEALSNTSYL